MPPCKRPTPSFDTMVDISQVRRVALLSLHSSPTAPLGRSDAGGMNLYVRRLADDLARQGIEVDVFTRRAAPHLPEIEISSSGARFIQLAGGPARRLPKSVLPLHIPATVGSLRAFARREDRQYDIVHSHYWISGLVALRCRQDPAFQAPLIHMFHTLARVKEFYAGGPDPSDSALRPDGERCIAGRADIIVGATEEERDQLGRLYGRRPEQFAVIPPGVDTRLFTPRDKAESRSRLNIRARHVVLFVGRLDRVKGIDVLLQAAANLPGEIRSDLQVILAGDHSPAHHPDAARYRKLVDRLGLGDIVEFRGIVPQAELPLYYSAADLCAVPSAHESFGMVAVESMACGTPVVGFRAGGLASTIVDGRTGFLAPFGDRAAYTARLLEALTSAQLPSMGRRARLSVQRYDWSNIVRDTLALYEGAVQQAAGVQGALASS